MHPQRRFMLLLNLLGGAAVLASYAHGFATYEGNPNDLWGGVPIEIRPLYTVSMLTATVGYFLFSYFIFFRIDPNRAQVAGRLGYPTFNAIYAGILAPSALWMPLTFAMLAHPNEGLWFAVRAVLTLVGLSSLALIAALLTVEPREGRLARSLAILGAVAFAFQTALLDALVWPTFFLP